MPFNIMRVIDAHPILQLCLTVSILSLSLVSGLALHLQAQSAPRIIPRFDPNVILSEADFGSTRAFGSVDSIQKYLESVNSPLKNYNQNSKAASQIIFDAARGNTNTQFGVRPQLNPGLILTLLQKEQSLISSTDYNITTDPQKKLRYATGYACPDNGPCNEKFAGFENQVNWAAYQLQFNFDGAQGGQSRVAPYIKGQTITTLDNYKVFLSNSATAAFYRYTPHVYWGNYNTWKIMISNGWGESSQTYTYSELDNSSLSKVLPKSDPTQPTQPLDSSLLKQSYRIGQEDNSVIALQTFLRQEGYFAHPIITGYYGSVSDQSARNYRLDKGILAGNVSDICKAVLAVQFSIGQEGGKVRELQRCLNGLGIFDSSLVTGYFGNVTSRALDVARSVSGTAVAKPEPVVVQPVPVANKCQDLKNSNWRIGDNGQPVRDLQQCLKDVGLFNWPGGITGFYGNFTDSKLKQWRGSAPATDDCASLKTQKFTYTERSEKVRSLQICLQKNNSFNYPTPTGFLGDITRAGLIQWRGYF